MFMKMMGKGPGTDQRKCDKHHRASTCHTHTHTLRSLAWGTKTTMASFTVVTLEGMEQEIGFLPSCLMCFFLIASNKHSFY